MSYRSRLFVQSLITIALVAVLTAAAAGIAPNRLVLPAVLAAAAAYGVAAVAARHHDAALRRLRDSAAALAAGELSVPPVLTAPGELGDLGSSLRQVAEQLGARINALQAEDSLLLALIESLNEGVFAVNARQQIVRMNGAGRSLLQAGDAPLPLSLDILPREATLHRAIHEGLRGASTGPVEVQVGERRLALTATPLDGGGAVVALYDVTPLRRLEQIRRDFVANVSHELRTPLTVVSGFAETLAEDDPPDELRRQFAEAIHTHTARMQRIVDDLLDLSRMESGGWVPKPERLQLAEVVDDALAAARERATAKGLELRADLAPGSREVVADRTAIRQILSNLVENSLRHTDSGEIVVFARREGGSLRLGVRDTGSGISPDHLPRVFERFYRADAARTRTGGGTGLGLAIVKHLAESHGGTAEAQSEPGRETSISVLLPQG